MRGRDETWRLRKGLWGSEVTGHQGIEREDMNPRELWVAEQGPRRQTEKQTVRLSVQ